MKKIHLSFLFCLSLFCLNAQVYLDDYFANPANPQFCEYKAAMDAANSSPGLRLIIRPGTWKIPEPAPCNGTPVVPSPNHPTAIALMPGDGVTIEFLAGAELVQSKTFNDKLRIIALVNDNVHIEGNGTLRGDLGFHDASTTKIGENTYLIYVNHAATNWSIKDLTIKESWGDGIFVGGSRYVIGTLDPTHATEGGLIENITSDNNRRNAIAVTYSNNLVIRNSSVINTGRLWLQMGFPRQLPGAGIDVEPNFYGYVTNLIVENVRAENNSGNGFTIQSPYTNPNGPTAGEATLTNVIARGNGTAGYTRAIHGLEAKEGGFATIYNLISENNTGNGITVFGAVGCEIASGGGCAFCQCGPSSPRPHHGKIFIDGGVVQNNGWHGLYIDNNENQGNNKFGGDNIVKNVFFQNNGNGVNYDNIQIRNGSNNLIENCSIVCSNTPQVSRHNILVDASAIGLTVKDCDFGVPSIGASCVYNSANVTWINNNCSPTSPPSNQPPTITSNGGGQIATIQVNENQTFVTTVIANDPNNSQITYSIDNTSPNGVDHALFTIDPVSGDLNFIAPPDYANPQDQDGNNEYKVDVVAANCLGANDTQSLLITVLDTDGPVITSNGAGQGAATSVLENETYVTTVVATNSASCSGLPLTYAIIYPPNDGVPEAFDHEYFAIDSITGELTFINPPAYANPLDSNADNVYIVKVKATDCKGSYDWQLLFVTVLEDTGGINEVTMSLNQFPENLQLFARDRNTNLGLVTMSGTCGGTVEADSLVLKVLRNGLLTNETTYPLSYVNGTANFTIDHQLFAERANYNLELYVKLGVSERLMATADSIVAGDIYIIDGQSNAEARNRHNETSDAYLDIFVRVNGSGKQTATPPTTSWYIGQGDGDRNTNGNTGQIGLVFAQTLSVRTNVPIAIFNNGVGGTPISFHQRNDANPTALTTNYGRLLSRLNLNNLADKVRGIIWYQGESDGGMSSQDYYNALYELYNDWQEDYANTEKHYIIQVRPGCGHAANVIVEIQDAQKRFADDFGNVELMTTMGLPSDNCHFYFNNGYEPIGLRMANLIDNEFFGGLNPDVYPPNIKNTFVNPNNPNQITLVLNNSNNLIVNPNSWNNFEVSGNTVVGATAITNNKLVLQLQSPILDNNQTITLFGLFGATTSPFVFNSQNIGMASFLDFPISGCLAIEGSVFLEGAMAAGQNTTMRTELYQRDLLPGQSSTPAGQPYNIAPWNYLGTEGSNWTTADYDSIMIATGQGIVDWVLVTFRTALDPTSTIGQSAALLLENGQLYFVHECYLSTTETALYVLVEHRNHLAAISADPIPIIQRKLTFDFTNANSYTGTDPNNPSGSGQKEINPGVYALFAGDGDQTTDIGYNITGLDKILWSVQNGTFLVYTLGDYNLDGDTNGIDNILVISNNGVFSVAQK